jgi:plasmid stabilization system protein ParE
VPAQTDFERLVVGLEASIKGFEREMRRARVTADKETKEIERSATRAGVSISKSFAGVGASIRTGLGRVGLGGLVGFFALDTIAEQAKKAASELAKIGDQAERIGITAEALQAVQYAASQNGGSAEAAASGLQKFSAGLADASTGAGDLYKIFQANNVAFKDAQGNLLPFMTNLENFANIASNATNDSELLEFSIRGFGRAAGPELIGVLKKGGEGIKTLASEAKAAGVIIDEDIIKKSQELDDAMGRWGLAIRRSVITALAEAAALIEKVIERTKSPGLGLGGAPGSGPNMFDQADSINKEASAGSMAGYTPPLTITVTPKKKPSVLPGTGDGGASKALNEAKRLADAYKNLKEGAEGRIEDLIAEGKALHMTEVAAEALRMETELLNRAKQSDIVLSEAQRAELKGLAERYAALSVELKQAKENQQLVLELGQDAVRGIISDLKEGTSAAEAFKNALSRVADKLLDVALFGTGGNGGIFGSIFSSIGASLSPVPQRHGGGPVTAGKMYNTIPGEYFVPSVPGRVVPKGGMGGAGPQLTYAPVIDARGADAGQIMALRGDMVRQFEEFKRNAYKIVLRSQTIAG